MSRSVAAFRCAECGARSSKWTGQCPECGAWNSLSESPRAGAGRTGYAGAAAARIVAATEVDVSPRPTLSTGIDELDRVLGGGLVPGSVVLVGGDPGIGKSTLLLQAVGRMAEGGGPGPVYVTGEESLAQVVMRARRLGLSGDGLRLLAETRVESILALVGESEAPALVVDSIQTLYTDSLESAPGSVAQVRESAARLVRHAKASGTALFLVGHVTKEGALAGPRVLEHMVDAVLYFESEADSRFRVIRAVKNRYGAANELGLFAMTGTGLRQVRNPSAIFLQRHGEQSPGSVVTVLREGTRPLLVELQALVDGSPLANPRRVAVGLDGSRLALLLATLHRHAGVVTADQDVYANVVGGVRASETAPDLALLAAVCSSLRDRPLARDLLVFGEVGLAGEVRPVPSGEERIREAAKHGFTRAVVPEANRPRRAVPGIEIAGVKRLADALGEGGVFG